MAVKLSAVNARVAGGVLRVNDARVSEEGGRLTARNVGGAVIRPSLGKKRHVLLKPV
jgi:hypothetical protein